MSRSLFTEAAAGRGLWIGLFPPFARPLPLVDGYATADDAHCTLVHLGKKAPDAAVEEAIRAAYVLSQEYYPVSAWLGGVARFRGSDAEGDPLVALLQNAGIRAMRARLIDLLGDHLVPQTFDYTPHVTLARVPRGESVPVPSVERRVVRLCRIGVVCGDERRYFDLLPPSDGSWGPA